MNVTAPEPELVRRITSSRCCLFASVRHVTKVALGATVVKLLCRQCTECGRRDPRGFVERNQRRVRAALARFRFVPIGYEKRGRD